MYEFNFIWTSWSEDSDWRWLKGTGDSGCTQRSQVSIVNRWIGCSFIDEGGEGESGSSFETEKT
jgi:hypothetical protein